MSDPNFSSFEAFLDILWPGNTLIGKRSQSYTTQCGEIGQFFKIFKMLLEFHKTYKNTCMLQISAQLEHLWPFYGHFRINFGPSREWYDFWRKSLNFKIFFKIFWNLIKHIEIHVWSKFQLNWSIFGHFMAREDFNREAIATVHYPAWRNWPIFKIFQNFPGIW